MLGRGFQAGRFVFLLVGREELLEAECLLLGRLQYSCLRLNLAFVDRYARVLGENAEVDRAIPPGDDVSVVGVQLPQRLHQPQMQFQRILEAECHIDRLRRPLRQLWSDVVELDDAKSLLRWNRKRCLL